MIDSKHPSTSNKNRGYLE